MTTTIKTTTIKCVGKRMSGGQGHDAYFSDRGRPFQSDRGR